jgi:hypothetical protein
MSHMIRRKGTCQKCGGLVTVIVPMSDEEWKERTEFLTETVKACQKNMSDYQAKYFESLRVRVTAEEELNELRG